MSNSSVVIPVPASGLGAMVDVSALVGTKTVQLAGTFRGSYDLLASQDDVSFDAILAFDAGNPEGFKQTVSGAFSSFRLRNVNATALTAVTCEVTSASAAGENHFTTVATLAPGFSGLTPAIDTWALFPPTGLEVEMCYLCRGGFRGSVVVLGSMDGAGYNPVGSFRVDVVPEGAPAVLELAPLLTDNKTRYVRLNVVGTITSSVTVTLGGRIPSSSPGPTPPSPVANWDDARFIFLSRDHGDDANVGYIDAPAGTVFTVPQARAVALKTTHRINELRPPVGDEHMVVVLFETSSTPYDDVIDGDGLGSDNRSGRSGYALMHTRGSDLTNSAADKQQLGCVTAIPGPNVDGSFTVAAAGYSALGFVMQLTGANLPDGYVLARYRLRIQSSASGLIYAPVIWGDPSATPDPTTIVAHFVPGSVSPGDKVWIETPGVTLHDYDEAQDFAVSPDLAAPLPALRYESYAVGLRIANGVFCFGPGADGPLCRYTHVFVDNEDGGTLKPSFCGDVNFSGTYVDETGNACITSGFGLAYSGNTGFVASGADGNLGVDLSSFAVSRGGTNPGIIFLGGNVDVRRTALQAATASVTSNLPGSVTFDGVLSGRINVESCGYANVSNVKYVSWWGTGYVTLTPRGPQNDPAHTLEANFAQTEYLFSDDPLTDPGYVLQAGMYSVRMDMNTSHAGTGIQMGFEDGDDSKFVLLTYASLGQTGFELEGGIKMVCHRSGGNYAQSTLLCPRGRIGKFIVDESSSPLDPGIVVFGEETGSSPTDYLLSPATTHGVFTGVGRIVGVTLSNFDPQNPYVVFGDDGIMLVKQADSVPLTGGGAPMYLVGTDGLVSPVPDPELSVLVGNVTPIAISWSGAYREISFQPGDGTRRAVADISSGFVDASDTNFVPMYSVPLLAGHKYKMKAHLSFSCSSAGGIKVQWLLTSSSRFLSALVVGQTPTATVTPFQSVVAMTPFHVVSGPTAGWVDLEGVLDCVGVDDGLQVQFAQQVADATKTSLSKRDSYIIVEEV